MFVLNSSTERRQGHGACTQASEVSLLDLDLDPAVNPAIWGGAKAAARDQLPVVSSH